MSATKSNYRTWLAKAEHDLLNIENNLKAPEIPWDTICFHAQQAAEKFLKAFLVFNAQPPIPTHDLWRYWQRACTSTPHLPHVSRTAKS